MSQDVLERIRERTISESDLNSEISKLEGVTELPSFWVELANDKSYPAGHRAIFICELFKRHVRHPINIVELCKLLHSPDWINADTVKAITHLKGELPVEWNLGETVLAISLLPGEVADSRVLYLRFSSSLDAETFVQMMSDSQCDAITVDASLLQAACG